MLLCLMPFCQMAKLCNGILVGGSTSILIRPISFSDTVGQRNEVGGIAFGAVFCEQETLFLKYSKASE